MFCLDFVKTFYFFIFAQSDFVKCAFRIINQFPNAAVARDNYELFVCIIHQLTEISFVVVVIANPKPRYRIAVQYADSAKVLGNAYRPDIFSSIDTLET